MSFVKGYEYFGYDPATYYSTEQQEIQLSSDTSFTSLDGGYEVTALLYRGVYFNFVPPSETIKRLAREKI